MNVKRYLKQQANQDKKAILDEDGGKTLRALGVGYPDKKGSRRRTWVACTASIAASLIVVLVCVLSLFPFRPHPEKFVETNFVTEDGTIEKMNAELHDFSVTIDENEYQTYITRTYDSVSHDALFYRLNINSNDNFLHAELYISCNADYQKSDFSFSMTPIVADLPQYTITYQSESDVDAQYGIATIACMAEIQGETDHIYITRYSELILDPNHTFLDSVQKFIQAIQK